MIKLRFRSEELHRLGRYTFLASYEPGGRAQRVVLATGPRHTEARSRLERSVALRHALRDHGGLVQLFGPVRYAGPVTVDDLSCYGAVFDFLPGRDLTALARSDQAERPPPAAAATIAAEIGEVLAALHAVSPAALGVPVPGADPTAEPAVWAGHIRHWIHALADQLRAVCPEVRVGGRQAREFHPVLRHLDRCVDALLDRAFGGADRSAELRLRLLHNDAHGGNFLADGGSDWRVTGVLDERLRCGDGLFDIAALLDWAWEIHPPATYRAFCTALGGAYGMDELLGDRANARLWLYHIERSVGRLAYYYPLPADQRARIAPVEVRNLGRHIELLDHVVGGAIDDPPWLDSAGP